MDPTTSTHFVSAAASGETWRDTAKKVLEQLESVKTEGFQPNIGFLYITDDLAEDAGSILTLFRSVTGIKHWSGCGAMGVCGNGVEYVDVPAISVLIGSVPKDKVRHFSTPSGDLHSLHTDLEPWLNTHDPMLVFVHADPKMEGGPGKALEDIDATVGGFMVGGLSSFHGDNAIIADNVMEDGVSGFVFAADIAVATGLSQGCVPIGPLHEISRADDHVIGYLDGETPVDVFTRDLQSMSREKRMAMIEHTDEDYKDELSDRPPSPQDIKGIAHIGFPIPGSDQGDYLVRNIVAIDASNGMIAVSEIVEDGQKIMFMHRDDDTVKSDLTQMLVGLHKRVLSSHGAFKPKAALYVSCVARAGVAFGPTAQAGGEMALIRDVLGDIPLAGFYAGGEISNTRIYGYTGILTLFL